MAILVREQTLSADLEEAKTNETTLRTQLKDSQTALRSIELEVEQLKQNSVDAGALEEAEERLANATTQTNSLRSQLSSSESEFRHFATLFRKLRWRERPSESPCKLNWTKPSRPLAKVKKPSESSNRRSVRRRRTNSRHCRRGSAPHRCRGEAREKPRLRASRTRGKSERLEEKLAQKRSSQTRLAGEIAQQEQAIAKMRDQYDAEQALADTKAGESKKKLGSRASKTTQSLETKLMT